VQNTPMRLLYRLTIATALVATVLPGGAAMAQGYFVPNQPAQPRPAAPSRPAPRQSAPQPQAQVQQQPLPPPPTVEIPGGLAGVTPDQAPEADQAPVAQIPQPPVPDLPALPRSTTPPTAVIGVLGVPEIMRGVAAAQAVEKVIGERREKLNEDAQKEQAAWRDLQQQLSAQRATLTPDQIRSKERELQERITNSQKSFRDRNRIIQEAAQYALGQIERTLIGVIRQVSESHGMNLVLHRQQVALNINEFDITDQVIAQMNKVMPSVTIPPDGVSPVAQAQADAAAAAKAAPVSAPATPPAAKK
jgi:Skp family chaperone for outer membrane proteins